MYFCDNCNCPMEHDEDYSFSDLGYRGNGVVSIYVCPECYTEKELKTPIKY